MAYLTDKEKRLLFSALSREKEICKQVDKECCREPYEKTLESVVESLERKFYYDRYEKEIRNKAIDEFAEALRMKCIEDTYNDVHLSQIFKIAEQLKGGVE